MCASVLQCIFIAMKMKRGTLIKAVNKTLLTHFATISQQQHRAQQKTQIQELGIICVKTSM